MENYINEVFNQINLLTWKERGNRFFTFSSKFKFYLCL